MYFNCKLDRRLLGVCVQRPLITIDADDVNADVLSDQEIKKRTQQVAGERDGGRLREEELTSEV